VVGSAGGGFTRKVEGIMLRRTLLVLLVSCIAVLAAGSAYGQSIAIGVKGGLNSSDLSINDPDDPSIDFDTKTGFAGGIFGQFAIGDLFAIQPEVLYSPKGAKLTDEEVTASINLKYIEIPILLMARIATNGNLRPLFYVAPVVSFESSCKLAASGEGVTIDVDCDAAGDATDGDFELKTKSTDFGMAFGVGLEVNLNALVLQLDGRYNLGLSNLNDTSGEEDISVKNRTWQFFLGVGYRIK